MKNVAYAVLLITSFALGCFGAFMVYRGVGMPTHGDAGAERSDLHRGVMPRRRLHRDRLHLCSRPSLREMRYQWSK